MNITISRRSKSTHIITKARYCYGQVDNQQSAETQSKNITKKNYSLNKAMHEQESNLCTKWLLSRCLRKPSIANEELLHGQAVSLQDTKEIRNLSEKVKDKQVARGQAPKIKLISRKGKFQSTKSQYKIKLSCKEQSNNKLQYDQKLTKFVYLQKSSHITDESKHRLQPFKSYSNGYQASNENAKSKLIDYSLKPSTVISLNNTSCQKQKSIPKSRLKLSNHFQSIMVTELKPFSSQSTKKAEDQIKSAALTQKKVFKQTPEQQLQDHLSRFEMVYPSENEFKIIDPQKSNHSLNTSYIRRRIQFSSELSDKTKLENYIYEPVYMINHGKSDTAFLSNPKNHKNSYSEFIKTVNIEDEEYFNSAKLHSQESMVIDKGLDQIFYRPPTFHKTSSNNNREDVDCSEKNCVVQMIDQYEVTPKDKLAHYGEGDGIVLN